MGVAEVENKTLVGQARFASKRDLESFVTDLKALTYDKYIVRARRVEMVNDDGRKSEFFEVEWYEA